MGDIKVGGNLVGSTAAAGDHNVQTVTFRFGRIGTREGLGALQKIEAVLVELKGIRPALPSVPPRQLWMQQRCRRWTKLRLAVLSRPPLMPQRPQLNSVPSPVS